MVGKAVGFVGNSYFWTDSAHGERFSYFIRWVRFGQIKHFTCVTMKKNIDVMKVCLLIFLASGKT